VPVKTSALPDGPRLYHQMLRGPRRRWWRPLVALLLIVPLALPLMFAAIIPVVLLGAIQGVPDLGSYVASATDVDNLGPAGFLYLNLALAVLIPTAGLSIWIAHRIRPRYLSSVAGGLRWKWLLRCLLVTLPVWLLYTGLGFLAEPPPASARPDHWVLLLIMVVLLTPFQSAGEEYLFRGWILQNLGSCFARPLVGLIVSLTVSTVAFAAAHLSPDPWVFGTLGCLAVASGVAAWRTGGLEAGIVMHAVNNVLVFFVVIIFGGFEQSFVGTDSTGTPMMLVTAVVAHGIVLALILWQAKRQGIDPYYRPTPLPGSAYQAPIDASWNPIPALNRVTP
jgi:membrane protease YdiL (CAAX protease family)